MRLLILVLLTVCLAFANAAMNATDYKGRLASFMLNGWDQTVAHKYLMLSYAAYCPVDSLSGWTCAWCQDPSVSSMQMQAVMSNTTTENLGYIVVDDANQQIVLVFRGTDNLENWIEDLKFFKADTPLDGVPNAFVASGFLQAYQSLLGQITVQLSQTLATHNGYTLFVTGHSLGGAMASLAAFDLTTRLGYAFGGSFTFGSPRVGDAGFAQAYDSQLSNTIRVTNHHDIVPHLPPEMFSFQHVATEIWENDANYAVCNGSGEDPNCADSVNILQYSISDHNMYMQIHQQC